MRVLVTGATGLLGANVVAWLCNHDYNVRALVRNSSDLKGLIGLNYEKHFGDLTDAESLEQAAKDCTYIVHAAANTLQWKTTQKEHEAVNLAGTKAIVQAAKVNNVSKIIAVGTANTFPLADGSKLAIQTDYINTKKAAEEYLLNQHDVPAVLINPSFMIGARDVKPSSGQAILHYLNSNLVMCPAGGKSFIHVMDVAEAIGKVMLSEVSGKRYLLANDNMSYSAFFKLIAEVTGVQKGLIPIPASLSFAGGTAGTAINKAFNTSVKLNVENAALINTKLYYDGRESYKLLNIEQRSMQEAVKDAVEWFKTFNYLK